jgi:hypothetical protein
MNFIAILLALAIYPGELNVIPIYQAPTQATDEKGRQSDSTVIIGVITEISLESKRMTVKSDSGGSVAITLDKGTIYRRLPIGEKSIAGAVLTEPAEIHPSDRVLVQGVVSEDRKTIMARQLIVMSQADVFKKQQKDREEWRARGIAGQIVAINPEAREISIRPLAGSGSALPIIIVAKGEKIIFRRYAPDSVSFSDARPGSFEELKVGDQLRALGEKHSDGVRFTPEEIVSGSFRSIGAIINAVDAGSNKIETIDIQTRRPLTVLVKENSTLRRLSPDLSKNFTPEKETNASLQDAMERASILKLDELKAGDRILITSTKGSDPSQVTAITLVAGLDAFLRQVEQRIGSSGKRGNTLDVGLPGGIGSP